MPFYDGISDCIWTNQGRILVGSIGSSLLRVCNLLIMDARHKPMKVLLIDDNNEVTDAIADFFDTMEVNYKVIDEGRKALSEILNQAEHYNVILLDIAIPQLSGHDILERLKEKDGLIESKNIVLFTASTLTDNDIQKYLNLGIKEVLRKPMSLNDITNVIQRFS